MKRGTPEHPKMLMLASKLEIAPYSAMGLMESIWHFTARYAPQGDIGKYSNSVISLHIRWDGDESRLIEALVDCRWLDQADEHRLIVHDWHDHSDDACDKYLASHGMIYANGAAPRRKNKGKTLLNNGSRDLALEIEPSSRDSAPPEEPQNGGQVATDTPQNRVNNGGSVGKSQASHTHTQNHTHTHKGGVGGARKRPERFKKPTLAEVKAYCDEKGYKVDILAWYAHYESNGWKVGKVPMQNWKGAIVTWARSPLQKKNNAGEEKGRETFRGLG